MDAADNDVCEGKLLVAESLLEAPLHDTATMFVRANLVAVGHASLEDELGVVSEGSGALLVGLLWSVRGLEGKKEGLDDVVAVCVSGEVEDVLGHLGAKGEDFLVKSGGLVAKNLDESLNGAGSMEVHRNLDDGGNDGLNEEFERLDIAAFNQLLTEIVAKLVGHDLREDVKHDSEEGGGKLVFQLTLSEVLLKLTLDHAAASLIKGQNLDLLDDVEFLSGQGLSDLLGEHLMRLETSGS